MCRNNNRVHVDSSSDGDDREILEAIVGAVSEMVLETVAKEAAHGNPGPNEPHKRGSHGKKHRSHQKSSKSSKKPSGSGPDKKSLKDVLKGRHHK